MKIYVTHASGFDFKNELYAPIRSSELNSSHQIILPHEEGEQLFNFKNFLKKCDIVIAEVSYPSTGQGIELGWANAYNIPVICIYKSGTRPSNALKAICDTFLEYRDSGEMISNLKKILDAV